MSLSKGSQAVLAAIRRSYRTRSRGPSLRELAAECGWTSTNSVRQHLAKLVAAKLVKVKPGEWGGIRLRKAPKSKAKRHALEPGTAQDKGLPAA